MFIPNQAEHEGICPYKCDICSMTFKTAHEFRKHKGTEHSDVAHDCKICGKSFSYRAKLKDHMLRHQEPEFQCSMCAQRFIYERQLAAHERKHRGEKTYSCTVCSSSFYNSTGLGQHMRGVHKISGPRGGKLGWAWGKKKKSTSEHE